MAKNIIVVGRGYQGENLVRNFAELGALHRVYNINADKLEHVKSLYPAITIEASFLGVL